MRESKCDNAIAGDILIMLVSHESFEFEVALESSELTISPSLIVCTIS